MSREPLTQKIAGALLAIAIGTVLALAVAYG
jgi:hypothetical protein